MKKAALPMSQSLQNRASVLAPAMDHVLPLAKAAHTATATKGLAVKPEPHQLDWPKARSEESPMTADADTVPASVSLAAAVASNNVDAVRALIKEDVDLRPENWYDTPVLVTAAAQGYEEIVQLLIAARANVNNGYEALPLTSAAGNGHLQIVRYLLAAGAVLNAQDTNGCNAVMAAAANGHLAVVRFLVESGAQLISTSTSETALTLAAKGGHQAVYAFLHKKMHPVVAPPAVEPDSAQADASTTVSVMDEMIAIKAEELKELLSSPETSSEAYTDRDRK